MSALRVCCWDDARSHAELAPDSSQLMVRAQEMLRPQWMSSYLGSTGSPGDERLLACKRLKWTERNRTPASPKMVESFPSQKWLDSDRGRNIRFESKRSCCWAGLMGGGFQRQWMPTGGPGKETSSEPLTQDGGSQGISKGSVFCLHFTHMGYET